MLVKNLCCIGQLMHSVVPSSKCSFSYPFLYSLFLLWKVYGAFRMYVKVLLMWDSKIQIDGGAKDVVLASMLEARNLVVLRVCFLKPSLPKSLF